MRFDNVTALIAENISSKRSIAVKFLKLFIGCSSYCFQLFVSETIFDDKDVIKYLKRLVVLRNFKRKLNDLEFNDVLLPVFLDCRIVSLLTKFKKRNDVVLKL